MAGYDGLNPSFAGNLQAMVAASGGRMYITSGFRSVERQQQLWDQALRKYGSAQAARKWVAPPGRSNHNHGIAADLGFANAEARQWAHANAGRYGLTFPMDWEPWHIEPIGGRVRGGRDAYTTAPAGFVNPRDQLELDSAGQPEDPYDEGVQARRLFEVIAAGPEAAQDLMASPTDELMSSPEQEVGSSGEPEQQISQLAQSLEEV